MLLIAKIIAFVGMAVSLAGCVTGDSGRHLVPIPAALVATMQQKAMAPTDPIMIRIFKKESELEVWKRDNSGQYALLKTYPMCRWSGQLGPKRREGDRQAPEGFYTVTPGLMNPRSEYHLSFNLGYPNQLEQALGYTGSALMVHGACTSAGCFAMTDDGVSEIYALAREAFAGGQPSFQVQALPFRMTPENMARHRDDPNMAFWKNLKEGSDYFEVSRRPPRVAACGRRYGFMPDGDTSGDCNPSSSNPIREKVLATQADDEKQMKELVQAGHSAIKLSYADGGMNIYFRSILNSRGVDALQALASPKVPVSQPEAARADPFTP